MSEQEAGQRANAPIAANYIESQIARLGQRAEVRPQDASGPDKRPGTPVEGEAPIILHRRRDPNGYFDQYGYEWWMPVEGEVRPPSSEGERWYITAEWVNDGHHRQLTLTKHPFDEHDEPVTLLRSTPSPSEPVDTMGWVVEEFVRGEVPEEKDAWLFRQFVPNHRRWWPEWGEDDPAATFRKWPHRYRVTEVYADTHAGTSPFRGRERRCVAHGEIGDECRKAEMHCIHCGGSMADHVTHHGCVPLPAPPAGDTGGEG